MASTWRSQRAADDADEVGVAADRGHVEEDGHQGLLVERGFDGQDRERARVGQLGFSPWRDRSGTGRRALLDLRPLRAPHRNSSAPFRSL